MLKSRTFWFCMLLLSALGSDAQVNLQTGSAVFTLPMFSWKDDKSRLTGEVALGYNSGNGLRVNDVASNVGQGWNLVAGGVITRMQVGEPDDQIAFPGTVGDDQDISRYPDGFLYSATGKGIRQGVGAPIINGCPNALTKYPIYGARNVQYTQHNSTVEDRQIDYFSFQFNGKSGMFVLDNDGAGTARSIGDNKMIIKFQQDLSMISQGIRTTITSFTIQDVDGMIYKFAQHGLVQVLHSDYCDANATTPMTQPQFKANNVYYQAGFVNSKIVNPYIIGSWYLSEIDDPLTGRKVTLTYNTETLNSVAGADISYNMEGNYSIVSYRNSITITPQISSIGFPDGHNVVFNYGNFRIDLLGDKALASVDITYQGRALSEYQFNTTYVIKSRYGTPLKAYEIAAARLYLKSVRKIGVDLKEDSPPYLFDYYLGSGVGDDIVPGAFCFTKDIWGYYNGSNSVAYDNSGAVSPNASIQSLNNNQLRGLCFLNSSLSSGQISINPKSGYAQKGLLRQIVYPTGGTLTYQYGQNSGSLDGVTYTTVGGVHVTQTSSTDGGYSNGCSNPIATQYNYVLSGGSVSSLWGMEYPLNHTVTYSHWEPEYQSYHLTFNCLPFGCCYWHFEYPGILSQIQAFDLVGWQAVLQAISPELGVLGLLGDIVDVINAFSMGGFWNWASVALDIIAGILTLIISCEPASALARDNTYTTYYNFDLNGVSPLPTQFKRVEIVENPGTIGKTVEEFSSSDDYPIWVPTNLHLVSQQRFAPWAYGLPKMITVYDAGGHMIKQTENDYDFFTFPNELIDQFDKDNIIPNSPIPTSLISCKCTPVHEYSQRSANWGNGVFYEDPSSYLTSSNGDLWVDFYAIYSGRVQLLQTKERTYRPTDASKFVQKTTSYEYNSKNFEVSRLDVTESNGSDYFKNMYYPVDYPNRQNAALQTMIQNNIVSEPISVFTTISRSPIGGNALSEHVTEFTQVANGDLRPARVLEQRFSQPNPTAQPYSPDNSNNTSIYKTTATFTYDANSNLISEKDEGGRSVTNIYDYSDKYVVGTVINADPVIDKPCYTSFETGSFGGWTQTGGTPLYNNSAITGTRSFSLTSQTLSATLNTARSYILSFWATNNGVTVTGGATLVKSAPTINGFTYYEYSIARTMSSVSVSGSSTIDELRLYPATARMKTITYDPLIGKTSECDANNRIQYYTYDNLGRLRMIQDENQYTLKMYEYNNISPTKQTGCPTNYANNLITETFYRSNCGSSYLGGPVTYTVPAAKYTSNISQADADAQADGEIMNLGQTNADANGTCTLLYFNTVQSKTDTTQNCSEGQVGGGVTYTVPAGKYSSTISQADANQKALDEIAANAIANANSPDHMACSVSTAPDWSWPENGPFYCMNVSGSTHMFINEIDMNPNSPTYQQSRWSDVGPRSACPMEPTIYAQLSYENAITLSDGSEIADVVVRFYSDAACTTPYSVTKLQVNYNYSDNCSEIFGSGSQIVDGNAVVLFAGFSVAFPITGCDPNTQICQICNVSFNLLSGGYVVE